MAARLEEREVFTCQSLTVDFPELLELTSGAWTLENIQSCSAGGLVCNERGRITAIRVGSDSATISRLRALPEQLSDLSQLETIEFYGLLTGTLPSSWSALHNLKAIELIGSKIHGDFPASWSELEHLLTLNVDFDESDTTQLTLPNFLMNLTRIALRGVSLSEFPDFLDSSSFVSSFVLRSAKIDNGYIPDSIWTNPKLAILEIDISAESNSFALATSIPHDLTPMISLTSLTLSGFAIEGEIPSQWPRGFAQLSLIDLPFLNGTLPQSLLDHAGLNALTLEKLPNLVGDLGSPQGSVSTLTSIKIEEVGFDGTISPDILTLPELTLFTLASCKKLKGPLPNVVHEDGIAYSRLSTLNFTGNPSLGGTIHESFALLNSLEQLILDDNGLQGSIPTTFGAFQSRFLYWLSISNNPMRGRLPDLDFELSGIAPVLKLRDIGLLGVIPTSLLTASYRSFDLSGNHLSLCDSRATPKRNDLLQRFNTVECNLAGYSHLRGNCRDLWPEHCFA